MVFPARCSAANCRKYMLVEDSDRGKIVACLICKAPVRVPDASGALPPAPPTAAPPPAAPLPVARLLPPERPQR